MKRTFETHYEMSMFISIEIDDEGLSEDNIADLVSDMGYNTAQGNTIKGAKVLDIDIRDVITEEA